MIMIMIMIIVGQSLNKKVSPDILGITSIRKQEETLAPPPKFNVSCRTHHLA